MKATNKSAGRLAAELAENPAIEQQVDQLIGRSQLVRALTEMRLDKGLTQEDIAKAFGCDQSKISRIEGGYDEDLSFGDLYAYLTALKVQMNVLFHDPTLPAAGQIKQLVMAIQPQLERLVELAKRVDGDESIISKIHEFCGEVLFNFLTRFQDSYSKICSLMPVAMPPAPRPKKIPEHKSNEACATQAG